MWTFAQGQDSGPGALLLVLDWQIASNCEESITWGTWLLHNEEYVTKNCASYVLT